MKTSLTTLNKYFFIAAISGLLSVSAENLWAKSSSEVSTTNTSTTSNIYLLTNKKNKEANVIIETASGKKIELSLRGGRAKEISISPGDTLFVGYQGIAQSCDYKLDKAANKGANITPASCSKIISLTKR